MNSLRSHPSKLSVFSSKPREDKIQAAKAALIQQQPEERARKAVELEMKKVEVEIKLTELELHHRLEVTKLEAEREATAAKNQAELASLEAFLIEQEINDLPNEQEDIKSIATTSLIHA